MPYRFYCISYPQKPSHAIFFSPVPILTAFYRILPIFTAFYRFLRFLTDSYRLLPIRGYFFALWAKKEWQRSGKGEVSCVRQEGFFPLHTIKKYNNRYLPEYFHVMKTISHLMVTLSTLMLLLFGSGGIAWQRCSCTGKVSMVLPAQKGCCTGGSSCMKVTIEQLSTANLQTDETTVPHTSVLDMARCLFPIPDSQFSFLYSQITVPQTRHTFWYPPGWTATMGMVMRV